MHLPFYATGCPPPPSRQPDSAATMPRQIAAAASPRCYVTPLTRGEDAGDAESA